MDRPRPRLRAALLICALVAGTVTILEPLKSAALNWSEIGIGFSELLTRLALPFAGALVCVSGIALVSAAVAPRRAVPMLVALYAGLWAQGSLFVWEYGIFDGSSIDWSEHDGKGLLEAGFWTAVFALALIRPDGIRRRALAIAGVIFALQVAALTEQLHRNAPFPEKIVTDEQAAIESLNRYSRELNVIIIVLDSFQSDFFSEAIRDTALRDEMPPGFTYFRNAVSLYTKTEFSLLSILSSRAAPDNVKLHEWKLAETERSLPTKLADEGFHSVALNFSAHLLCSPSRYRFECVRSEMLAGADRSGAVWRRNVSDLFALGVFRLSPHFLKPRVYDDGSWQIRRLYPLHPTVELDERIDPKSQMDLAVFQQLIESASADAEGPQFRFIHLFAVHPPSTTGSTCAYKANRAFGTTRCVLGRLYDYLERLDEIGVYDQSLIFVVADHGHLHIPLKVSRADPSVPLPEPPDHEAGDGGEGQLDHIGRAVPLFLLKPIDDREPLRTSDRAVSLCDIPLTVFDALGLEGDFGCESILTERSRRQTPRMHYRYPSLMERRKLPPEDRLTMVFEKYAAEGHSWRAESWVAVDAAAE